MDESQGAGTTIFAAELAPPVVREGTSLLYWRFIHFPMQLLDDNLRRGRRGIFQLSWMNSLKDAGTKIFCEPGPHQSSPSSTTRGWGFSSSNKNEGPIYIEIRVWSPLNLWNYISIEDFCIIFLTFILNVRNILSN